MAPNHILQPPTVSPQEPTKRWRYRQAFDSVMLVLAVVALALASIQFWDSKIQTGRLKEISERISTQSVGVFPNNAEAVIQLIGKTRKSIKIMADLAGYGEFSAPPYFDRYMTAIRTVHQSGYPVELIFYGDPAAKDDIVKQFKLPDGFNELKRKKSFTDFFQIYHQGLKVPSSSDDFLQILLQRESEIRRTLHDDMGITFLTAPTIPDLPFFLWLRDGEEAIFSLYNLGHTVREVSFYTNDGNLTKSLEDIFDEVHEKVKPAASSK